MFFEEKENASFNSLFLCVFFYLSHGVNILLKCASGRLGTLLVSDFRLTGVKYLSIFHFLTDRTAEYPFRNFSAILFKPLTIYIVSCIYVKPSFFCSTSQSAHQWLISSMSLIGTATFCCDSPSFMTWMFCDMSHVEQQRGCYSMLWMLEGMKGFPGWVWTLGAPSVQRFWDPYHAV